MPDDEYPPVVADRWEDVLADASATAAEYREEGWAVLELHPGDVTPLTDDPFGFDVLAPDDEFADLRAAVEDVEVDRTSVYRAQDGGVRFYVTVAEATDAGRAVVVPTFLLLADLPALQQRAEDAGVMYTHVRTLSLDERVTFRHEDPDRFFEPTD